MKSDIVNKVNVTFEFESIEELRDFYGALCCGCRSVHMREVNASKDENINYFSDVWEKLSKFAENFNPANLNA